jgi:hypothetical protein
MMDAGWQTRGLWARWVVANTVGETLGLGVTAAVAIGLAATGDGERVSWIAAAALAMLLAGAFEGGVVGYAQWRVLRRPLPMVRARSWVGATVLGALVAWSLGMLPSTVVSMGGQAGGEPPIGTGLQLVLAAVMGFFLGPVLGVPQWVVLRRFVRRAGWWVLANSIAWAAGMPLIFLVAGSLPPEPSPAVAVAAVVAACAGAGAVVGAVHGLWLVVLVRRLPTPATLARHAGAEHDRPREGAWSAHQR